MGGWTGLWEVEGPGVVHPRWAATARVVVHVPARASHTHAHRVFGYPRGCAHGTTRHDTARHGTAMSPCRKQRVCAQRHGGAAVVGLRTRPCARAAAHPRTGCFRGSRGGSAVQGGPRGSPAYPWVMTMLSPTMVAEWLYLRRGRAVPCFLFSSSSCCCGSGGGGSGGAQRNPSQRQCRRQARARCQR